MIKTNECIFKKEFFNLFIILNWGLVFLVLFLNYEIIGF